MVSEIIVILQCGKCYLMKCVYHKGVGNQSFLHGFLCKYLEIRENRVNKHTHKARALRYSKTFNLQTISGIFPLPVPAISVLLIDTQSLRGWSGGGISRPASTLLSVHEGVSKGGISRPASTLLPHPHRCTINRKPHT